MAICPLSTDHGTREEDIPSALDPDLRLAQTRLPEATWLELEFTFGTIWTLGTETSEKHSKKAGAQGQDANPFSRRSLATLSFIQAFLSAPGLHSSLRPGRDEDDC